MLKILAVALPVIFWIIMITTLLYCESKYSKKTKVNIPKNKCITLRKEDYKESQNHLLLNFYLLEHFRNLVLKYKGKNLFIRDLKTLFENIQSQIENEKKTISQLNIETKDFPFFKLYPKISIFDEWISCKAKSDDVWTDEDAVFEENIQKMFLSNRFEGFYFDITHPYYVFTVDELKFFTEMYHGEENRHNFLDSHDYCDPRHSIRIFREIKAPQYVVIHCMGSEDNMLESKSKKTIYSITILNYFYHFNYELVSFHVYKKLQEETEIYSYYRNEKNLFRNILDDIEVDKDEIVDDIFGNDKKLVLFYELM